MYNKVCLQYDNVLRIGLGLAVAACLIAPAHAVDKMYWVELTGNIIKNANLDGSGIATIVSPTGANPIGIDIDVEADKLYWTEFTDKDVEYANLNGSSPQQVFSNALQQPVALAVDTVNDKVYWTDIGTNAIRKSDLNGSNQAVFLSVPNIPYGLALDVANNFLYWTEGTGATGAIKRSSLAGTGVTTVFSTGASSTPLGLALDQAAGKLYWADDGLNQIRRVNTDGSTPQAIVSSGLVQPGDVEVHGAKVYWVDQGLNRISRANKDGSSVETLIGSGLSSPQGLVILGNTAPIANIGGPYVINEGDALNLDASASLDPDTDPITLVEWELDNDGLYDEGTGMTLVQNWATIAAMGWSDGANPISVRVSDGLDAGIANGSVTVNNLPPNIVSGGPYTINEGSSLILNANGTSDPGNDPLTYAWDLDNDTSTDTTGISPTVTWGTLQTLGLLDGLYTMVLSVNDGLDTAQENVNLTIQNLPPNGQLDTYTVNEDIVLNVSATGVLANDMDPGGDALSVSAFDASSAYGAVVNVSSNGAFTYDPRFVSAINALILGQEITDTFQYTVNDGIDSDVVVVEVRVQGVANGGQPVPLGGRVLLLIAAMLLVGCGIIYLTRLQRSPSA